MNGIEFTIEFTSELGIDFTSLELSLLVMSEPQPLKSGGPGIGLRAAAVRLPPAAPPRARPLVLQTLRPHGLAPHPRVKFQVRGLLGYLAHKKQRPPRTLQ